MQASGAWMATTVSGLSSRMRSMRAWVSGSLKALWPLYVSSAGVGDLVAGRLRRLSAESQQLLGVAGCIGHEFDAVFVMFLQRRRGIAGP